MRLARRQFLRSVALGAGLVACGDGPEEPREAADAGSACGPAPAARPPELSYPAPKYFAQLSADLHAAGVGTPVALIDLDRAEANIREIVAAVSPHRHRIVEKSLPSLDLLAHVSEQSGSTAFLVLHLPFLPALLQRLSQAEVLVGKAHLTTAIQRLFARLPAGLDAADVARRVTFLADGTGRLAELTQLAGALGLTLQVAIELDVGLRRSGVAEPDEVAAMLEAFLSSSAVRFAGFSGYDGHVAYSPAGTLAGMQTAWEESTQRYRSFVDVLQSSRFQSLARQEGLVFHGGGTATCPMYRSSTPVNDVAAGGGVLRPGCYPNHVIGALVPALFLAAPVLRRFAAPRLPFFSAEQSACVLEGQQGLTVYGGAWPAYFTHPAGIRPAPLVSDPTDVSLVPNQGLLVAPAATAIVEGDWVFFHPRQSDALFQFEEIRLVRQGRLSERTFAPFPRRY